MINDNYLFPSGIIIVADQDLFGHRDFSKDHRPDLHQMVVGAVLDDNGRPICREMRPGNTTDVTSLMPQVERLNQRQARKDAADREAIIESLKRQLKKGPKALVGNKGYRKCLKLAKGSARIDPAKIKAEARFDGKWVLTTNIDLPVDQVALKYKELWRVERVFRDVQSLLETRPVYQQNDANIAGHVFCSFLALILRKERDQRLADNEHRFERSDIKQDLKALKQVKIKENGKCFAIRTESKGVCVKVFQSVRVALPPTIKELD